MYCYINIASSDNNYGNYFILCIVAAGQNCERINFLPVNLSSGRIVHIVRYNGQPCDESFNETQNSHPFCGDSGWGDEEAAVVCGKERDTLYGIGSKSLPVTYNVHAKDMIITRVKYV